MKTAQGAFLDPGCRARGPKDPLWSGTPPLPHGEDTSEA